MRVAKVSFVSQLIVLIVLELLVTADLLLAFADLGDSTLPVALGTARRRVSEGARRSSERPVSKVATT